MDSSNATDTTQPDRPEGTDPAEPTEVDCIRPCEGARVLVIEDEAPVANFLQEALAAKGCEVAVAMDGAAGLDMFRVQRFDLIVCDLLVPKRNGFKLIDDFRQEAPEIPVVACTGIYKADRYQDELAHARMFLSKPLGVAEVDRITGLLLEHLGSRASGAEQPAAAGGRGPSRSREPWIPTSLVPLPRMLHLLWHDRRTGLLTQRAGDHDVVFMLENGRLRFVRSSAEEHRLDRVVGQLGKIPADVLERATKDLGERRIPTRFGEVLVEMGAITQDELDRCIQIQLRRIIHAAFNETDAETLFTVQDLPDHGDVALDLDARAVIVAGCASARDEGDRLIGHLPDGACLVTLNAALDDEALKLPAAVRRLLETLSGPVHLSDFVSMAELVGLRGRSLAFGLLCAEVLVVSEARPEWSHEVGVHGGTRDMTRCVPASAFLEIEDQAATGLLRARIGKTLTWFAFEDGQLRQAGSSDVRALLGQRLVESGFIAAEDLGAALRQQARSKGRPLGHVLMEMGLLTPEALWHSVGAQVLWVARDVLTRDGWDEATFTDDELPDREPIDLGLTVSEAVLEAMRHVDEHGLQMIARALAEGRPEIDTSALAAGRFLLTESEELVSGALASDTRQVLRAALAADRPDPDVLRTAVLALLLTPETVAA